MQTSFNKLYTEHLDYLIRYINKKVSDYDDANCIAHDVLLQTYNNLDKYDDEKGTFTQWITGIAKNKTIDYLRRATAIKRKHLNCQEYIDRNIKNNHDRNNTNRTDQFAYDSLQKAMNKLSNIDQEIIILHYYHGYNQYQLAEIFNIPRPTVCSKIHRGLRKLKNILQPNKQDLI